MIIDKSAEINIYELWNQALRVSLSDVAKSTLISIEIFNTQEQKEAAIKLLLQKAKDLGYNRAVIGKTNFYIKNGKWWKK